MMAKVVQQDLSKLLFTLDSLVAAVGENGGRLTTNERTLYDACVAMLLKLGARRAHVTSMHCWCDKHRESYPVDF